MYISVQNNGVYNSQSNIITFNGTVHQANFTIRKEDNIAMQLKWRQSHAKACFIKNSTST